MMKRAVFSLILMIFTISFAGCSGMKPLPGEELILSARDNYASLDSARVEVRNDVTGEVEQTFTFKYDEKDVMIYSYIGDSEGVHLRQYNNGREQFTDENGVITALTVTDRDFTAYSRDVKYPMADKGMILFYKAGVIAEQSSVQEMNFLYHPGPVTWVHHEYDVSKIASEYSGAGELTAFSVDYHFDSDGNLLDFSENADVTEDGKAVSYRYLISISDINSVKKVENVVDISNLGS